MRETRDHSRSRRTSRTTWIVGGLATVVVLAQGVPLAAIIIDEINWINGEPRDLPQGYQIMHAGQYDFLIGPGGVDHFGMAGLWVNAVGVSGQSLVFRLQDPNKGRHFFRMSIEGEAAPRDVSTWEELEREWRRAGLEWPAHDWYNNFPAFEWPEY